MAVDFRINGRTVDTDGVLSMPLTKQFDDMTNPVAIKNSVSKTITIPATTNNNNVFGNIWRIDHITGTLFDASKRVPFVLANDGALVATGYVKLTNIKKTNGEPRAYEIHLYGGLGDFFYELESKDLQDVRFRDDNMRHQINREAVKNPPEGMKYFMAYQGKYDGFESSKWYNPQSGEIEELTQECDEHQVVPNKRQEFRSYYQRPAVKVSELISNIFAGSQYSVHTDSAFFKTPYWSDTYLGLTPPPKEDATIDNTASIDPREGGTGGINFREGFTVQMSTNALYQSASALKFKGANTDWYDPETGIIHAGITPEAKKVSIQIDYQIGVTGYFRARRKYRFFWRGDTPLSVGVRLVDVATGGEVARKTRTYANTELGVNFNKSGAWGGAGNYSRALQDGDTWGANSWVWNESLVIPPNTGDVRAEFIVYIPVDQQNPNWNNARMDSAGRGHYPADVTVFVALNPARSFLTIKTTTTTRSHSWVDYTTYMPTGTTQLAFVKNYFKAFGMLWEKDPLTKDIRMFTRNEFFADYKIIDWTDRIDHGKEINITPITFDYRYALLRWAEAENERAKNYRSKYRNEYGGKKLDTGYEFDGDDKALLEDDIIQNAVISQEYDYLFTDRPQTPYPNRDDKILPAIFEQKGVSRERCDDTMQLFFWNGWQPCRTEYFITDDRQEMAEKGFCWNGETTLPPQTAYPSMTRLITTNGQIWSLDFAKPSLSYYPVTEEEYPTDEDDHPANVTIYSRFWRDFMRERLNKDTRVMTCYAWITPAEFATWKFNTFVKIENTLWHVNKIMDFDPSKRQATKCELIRVNDIKSYINGQTY